MGGEVSLITPKEADIKNDDYLRRVQKEREETWLKENALKSRWCIEMRKNFIKSFNQHAIKHPEFVVVPKWKTTTNSECGYLSTESLKINGWWKTDTESIQKPDLEIDPSPFPSSKKYDHEQPHVIYKRKNY